MPDVREQILARLVAIAAEVPVVATAGRNRIGLSRTRGRRSSSSMPTKLPRRRRRRRRSGLADRDARRSSSS
jgi:hypothetical protein